MLSQWINSRATLTFIVILMSGCAATPNYPPHDRNRWEADYGIIGAAEVRFQPNFSDASPLSKKVEDTVRGAAGGALLGASSCIFSPSYYVYCLPIGTVAGAAVGAILGVIEPSQAGIIARSGKPDIQISVREYLLDYAKQHGISVIPLPVGVGPSTPEEVTDYTLLTQPKPDTVIEIGVLDISFNGGWFNDFNLVVKGRSRLVRSHDNKILDTLDTVYTSADRKRSEWVYNKGELLRQELRKSYHYIAEQAVDEFLLLYYPQKQDSQPSHPTSYVSNYVLEPIHPKTRTKAAISQVNGTIFYGPSRPTRSSNSSLSTVDSVQPILTWKALPEAFNLQNLKHRLSNLTYEIRVYEGESELDLVFKSTPGRLVDSHYGIADPKHQIEKELTACGKYYWTVRASFYLDGYPRVTEWGGRYGTEYKPWINKRINPHEGFRYIPFLNTNFSPSQYYYAFQVIPPGHKCDK